jgi:hypothetical protein
MNKFLLIIAFSLFLLPSCTPVQAPSDGRATEEESAVTSLIYGTWTRQATFVDGALENNKPATLKINADDSYSSGTDVCTTSGTVQVADETATLTMTQSNCPGNLQLPYTAAYSFKISEDDKTMSWTTANMREDYVRAE